MKKTLSITQIFAIFSLVVSTVAAADCIDRRAALIEPCPEGQKMIFLQGNCKEAYEFESAYCEAPLSQLACFDTRRVRFAPCPEGEQRIFVQGRCKQSYEIEHHYCAAR